MLKKMLWPSIERNRERIASGQPPIKWVRGLLRVERKIARPVYPASLAKNASLRNKYSGKRCLIVGSAPSINELPLHLVGDETFVFALNRASLLSERFGKPVDALVVSDPLAYQDYGSLLPLRDVQYAFLSTAVDCSEALPNIYRFGFYKFPTVYDGFISTDLSSPLYHGHTVALYACQIAFAMGFSEIVLVGIDLTFGQGTPHFYSSSDREKDWSRSISLKYQGNMEASFQFVSSEASRLGKLLVNASPVRGLPSVKSVPFTSIFPFVPPRQASQ